MVAKYKLQGLWENPEMNIRLKAHEVRIFWKKSGDSATGSWTIINNVIHLSYEMDNVPKLFSSETRWKGKIQKFNKHILILEDLTAEVGKIDEFHRKSSIIKFGEKNAKHMVLAFMLSYIGFGLLRGTAEVIIMTPEWLLVTFSFVLLFWLSKKYSGL